MRKYDKKIIYICLFLILCLFAIGYATIVSNITINGIADIKSSSFSIQFMNLHVTNESVEINTTRGDSAATINTTTKTDVNYTIVLQKPGDVYEFYVDVVNNGSLDAMIDTITSKYNGIDIESNESLPDYVNYTATYVDGMEIARFHFLAANGGRETIKIRLEYRSDIDPESLPDIDEALSFSFGLKYIQADSRAIKLPSPYTRLFTSLASNVEQVNISTNDHSGEMRFIGSNPNNYVVFNNEATCDENLENCSNVKWRIIGVFDGQLKLIRNEKIMKYLSWDSTTGLNSNNNYGINQWGPSTYLNGSAYEGADLMRLLNPGYQSESYNNSLYWNGGSGYCYNDPDNSYQACDFSSVGLTDTTSRSMIDGSHDWNIGFIPSQDTSKLTASFIYNAERGNNSGRVCTTGDWCSDLVNRNTLWSNGHVGLIYISDYLYATNGGNTSSGDTGRSTCLGYSGTAWGSHSSCVNNNWLYTTSLWQYSLSPTADTDLNDLLCTDRDGSITISGAAYNDGSLEVKPVVYIKLGVSIVKGDGTESSPFVLSY